MNKLGFKRVFPLVTLLVLALLVFTVPVLAQEATAEAPVVIETGADNGTDSVAIPGWVLAALTGLVAAALSGFALYKQVTGASPEATLTELGNPVLHEVTRFSLIAALFFALKTDATTVDEEAIEKLAKGLGFTAGDLGGLLEQVEAGRSDFTAGSGGDTKL